MTEPETPVIVPHEVYEGELYSHPDEHGIASSIPFEITLLDGRDLMIEFGTWDKDGSDGPPVTITAWLRKNQELVLDCVYKGGGGAWGRVLLPQPEALQDSPKEVSDDS